jgi:hypothetical protein
MPARTNGLGHTHNATRARRLIADLVTGRRRPRDLAPYWVTASDALGCLPAVDLNEGDRNEVGTLDRDSPGPLPG